MPELVYPGPAESVHVPAANVTAVRGVPVDVPDEFAADLQQQGWTVPKPTKKSTKSQEA